MLNAKVTRDDVARVAGTSAAVVSYVVNNGPRAVAPATRERVLAAIESTGYRPDSVARALASGRSRTYGCIVPNIANPFIASLAHAVEDAAFRRGFALLLGNSADDPHRESELVNTFLEHRIDGLIYYGVDRDHEPLKRAIGRVPVVVLDDGDLYPGTGAVRIDERAAAAAATAHLIDHGYDSIGTISGPLGQQNAQDRVHGWEDALVAAGKDPDAQVRLEAPYTRRGGYEAAVTMFRAGRPPAAIFISNEPQAIGFLAAAHERGIRVPHDTAILCFNGTSNAEYTIPSLSAIEQPIGDISSRAIDLLGSGVTEASTVLCDFQIATRRSCGCDDERATRATSATRTTAVAGVPVA